MQKYIMNKYDAKNFIILDYGFHNLFLNMYLNNILNNHASHYLYSLSFNLIEYKFDKIL